MIDSKKFKEFKEILKSPKLKIIAFTLAITVVTSIIVRGSNAFFTDAKQSESVFTAGNVYIELSEAAIEKSEGGHLIENVAEDRIYGNDINDTESLVINNYGVVFPGGDDKILWSLVLQHQPHTLDVVLRITPVAERIHVTQVQFVLITLCNACSC